VKIRKFLAVMRNEYPGGIIMESSPLESTGGKVWNASIRFYDFIRNSHYNSLQDSDIIELGSGCGWLGLRLSKEFSNIRVTMTEQRNFGALAWLEHNVSLNPEISVSTTELDWANIPQEVRFRQWDLVIGCELVYSYEGARLLPRVISSLLAHPGAICYYAHSLFRFEAIDEVLLSEFKLNNLDCTVVYGQERFSKLGKYEDLFPDLELVIFKLVRSPSVVYLISHGSVLY
jgi:hypothetical protein